MTRILIIDDNKDIAEMLSRYLNGKGFDCVVSNDGVNGLNLIKKEKFDTVLLDLAMPTFGGLDVIAALEKDHVLKDQRIIVFTASSASDEELDKLLEKDGVESYLRKPVKLSDIIRVIPES